MVGTTLGHYEILEPLGSGGMGDVYRARDTTLKRDVAIKVLSEAFATDTDRLARLEREAHLLASLNHPNIATIHSLEQEGDTRFLVLELVKGESLEQRLVGGPLTVEKALDIAKQIAEALEAAHGEGMIHRDLKPANVLITPDGRAKVLDFGIAKVVETGPQTTATQATNLTVAGTLIGTVPYMSPEQIRSEGIDKRADIWAFGCVLYEMLTGGNPFARETIADTLAAIIEQEPDWGVLPTATPDSVRSLLHRCLQKDTKLRLRDIGDAWVEMNALLTDPSGLLTGPMLPAETAPTGLPIPAWRSAAPWIAAAVVVGAALGALGMWSSIGARGAPGLSPLRPVEIGLPADQRLSGSIVLSPDGLDLVYVAESDGQDRLYHRPMSEREAAPLEGTDGARDPFFSPDGEWVGFFVGSGIKKVELSGGQALTVCSECVRSGRGATWRPDQTIVFGDAGHLYSVPADRGTPTLFARRGPDADVRYSRPSALPGSPGVLVQLDDRDPGSDAGIGVAIVLPDSVEHLVLVESGGARPRYSPTGHVIFSLDGALFAVRFDLQLLEAIGQQERLLDGVGPRFSFSSDGTLVYLAGTASSGLEVNEVVWVDLEGNVTPLIDSSNVPPNLYWDVRLSPDARRLALSVQAPVLGASQRIWVWDIARRNLEPITFEGVSRYPVWSHDGSRIAFSTDLADQGIQWKALDEVSGEQQQQLTTIPPSSTAQGHRPGSFSPDGRFLAFRGNDPSTPARRSDIMILPMEDGAPPFTFVSTPEREGTPRFSPDGDWLTYTSDATGDWEVYVTPFPELKINRVSTDGGWHAVWAPDGHSMYYRSGDKMMEVSFEPGSEPGVPDLGVPELLFEGRYDSSELRARYDIAPGGEGFVMLTVPRSVDAAEQEQASPDKINVVFNWFEDD